MLGVATSMTIAFSALQYFHSEGGEYSQKWPIWGGSQKCKDFTF